MKGKKIQDLTDTEPGDPNFKRVAHCPEFSLFETAEKTLYLKRSERVEWAHWKHTCRFEDSEKITSIDDRIVWIKAIRYIYYSEISKECPEKVPIDIPLGNLRDPSILANHITSLIGGALKKLVELHPGGLACVPASREITAEIGRIKGLFGSAVDGFAAAEQLKPEGLGDPKPKITKEILDEIDKSWMPEEFARFQSDRQDEEPTEIKMRKFRFEAAMIASAEEIFIETRRRPKKSEIKHELELFGYKKPGRNSKGNWRSAFDCAGLAGLPD